MALKADRNELDVDISFFYNAGTAERGGVVSITSVGSGAAMDQAGALVAYTAAANDVIPVGILLNDVVNLDLTRQHINWHKDEVQKGGKVSILKKGYVVTNNITGTPTAGALAYLDDLTAGNLTVKANVDTTEYISVGRWMSSLDEDGYAKVEINLPAGVMNTDAGALE
jgi:hypothetical protein|tara:strand:+ start:9468 stop:9974 length:507 start_codon:yes stop_codon:yes gene_type:complete